MVAYFPGDLPELPLVINKGLGLELVFPQFPYGVYGVLLGCVAKSSIQSLTVWDLMLYTRIGQFIHDVIIWHLFLP